MSNELTEIGSLARSHGESALATLAEVASDENAPPAPRITAANSLLDRGYGKLGQTAADMAAQPVKEVVEFVRTIVDPKARPEEAARQREPGDASDTIPLIEAPAIDQEA